MSDYLLLTKIFEDLKTPDITEAPDKKMIGLWLPGGYKDRFDILQDKTNREFGKRVQALIMESIDHVEKKL